MQINIARLEKTIKSLSSIGNSQNGITRPAFSPKDMEARRWLISQMEACGLHVHTDPAGNIRGRLHREKDTPIVACGSHIDTVNCGGPLDGALGVLAGLEALRTIKDADAPLAHPLEVIAFSDEEGRFGGMLGSRALCGMLAYDEIKTATDTQGVHLHECMKERGFDPENILNAKETPDTFKAFIELHIEQGPVLENKDIPIGIVSAITGLFKWQVSIKGQANHAGTTPMDMRRDAFQGLASFATQIDNILQAHGSPHTKTTIGKVELLPGSPNVVPGECLFTLEARDTDPAILSTLEQQYREALTEITKQKSLAFNIHPLSNIEPVLCDENIIALITKAAQNQNFEFLHMPSGAAHDAQNMARMTKVGMIFVPSINGISHSPLEDTSIRDIEKGANLLLETLYTLAQERA